MFEIFIFEKHVDLFSKLKYNIVHKNLFRVLNSFLYDSCKYLLIYQDNHFVEYAPIFVVYHNGDGNIICMCELFYNPSTNLLEIYNICVHPSERRKNYCKILLNYIIEEIQPVLKCNLWIAVSSTNPMYSIATEIYQKAGFTDDVKRNAITPSQIVYENGFLEMYKYYKNVI